MCLVFNLFYSIKIFESDVAALFWCNDPSISSARRSKWKIESGNFLPLGSDVTSHLASMLHFCKFPPCSFVVQPPAKR